MDQEKFENWKIRQRILVDEISRLASQECTLSVNAEAMTTLIFNLQLAMALQMEMGQSTAVTCITALLKQLFGVLDKRSPMMTEVLFSSFEEFTKEGALDRYRQFMEAIRDQVRIEEKKLVQSMPACPHCKKAFEGDADIFQGADQRDVQPIQGIVGICPHCAFIFYHKQDREPIACPEEVLKQLPPFALAVLEARRQQIRLKVLKKVSGN